MGLFEQRVADLQEICQDMMKQFQIVNAEAANGPHTGLNIQELRVTEYLGNKGPRMMRELAEHIAVAVNTVTTIVDNLERKGLVRRQRSDDDRRVVHVELTEEGKAVHQSIVNLHSQLFRSMLSALTEDEQEIFLVLYRKIARAGRTQLQNGISIMADG